MPENPRPLNLGEILDRTAQLFRARFLAFLGIALLPTGLLLVCATGVFLFFAWFGSQAGASPGGQSSANPALAGVLALGFLAILGLVITPLVLAVIALSTAALTHAAASAWLDEKISIRDSYRRAWKRGRHFVYLIFLQGLLVWAIPVAAWTAFVLVSAGIAAAMGAAGAGASGGAALGGLFVLVICGLVGYGIWMSIRLSLAFPACVVEGIGAWASIPRSARLSAGSRGRICLLYLLAVALNWILSLAITVPATIGLSLYAAGSNPQRSQTVGMILVFVIYGSSIAVQAFTKPVYAIALLLFYFDQRIRKEGFDIEWMMHRAGLVVPPPPQPEATPWTAALPTSIPQPAPTETPAEAEALPNPEPPDSTPSPEPPPEPQPEAPDEAQP